MLALLVTIVQMLLQEIRKTEPIICLAYTGIPGAGHGGNPFSHLFWLAKEETWEPTAGKSTAPAPSPTITYLPPAPSFKMLSSLTYIQNTDLDMPTPKQATT
eukprot:223459-Pelagomonas_calceolata.AAC.1